MGKALLILVNICLLLTVGIVLSFITLIFPWVLPGPVKNLVLRFWELILQLDEEEDSRVR